MRLCFTAPLLFCFTSVIAQTISLPGTIVIQNSEYETGHKICVSDASIRAPFAKAVTSDKDGQFSLAFAGVESGTPVRLTVSKPGLQVVNTGETEQVIIGRVPRMQVVMADADKLAMAQMALYHVMGESIARSYQQRMVALRDGNVDLGARLAAMANASDSLSMTMESAIDRLTNERDQAIDRALELSRELSHVNMDDASAIYREAYLAFSKGDLQRTLLVLDRNALDADYAAAADDRRRGAGMIEAANNTMRQLVQSYQLRADVLQAKLDLPGALAAARAMGRIVDEQRDAFDATARVRVLDGLATMHHMMGAYDSAMVVLQEADTLARRSLPAGHPLTARVRRDVCMVQNERAHFAEGIAAGNEAVSLTEIALGPDHPELAQCHQYLGMVLSASGEHHLARDHYTTAYRIFRGDSTTNAREIGGLLTNIGTCQMHLGELDSAEVNAQAAIELLKKGALPGDPSLAVAYEVLGVIYQQAGDYDKAIAMAIASRSVSIRSLGPDHPRVGLCYNTIASGYWSKGDLDSAIANFHRSIDIFERSLGNDHHVTAIIRSNMADAMRDKGDAAGSLKELRASIDVMRKVYKAENDNIAEAYNSMGLSYEALERWDDALACYDTALASFAHMADVDSSSIAHIHTTRAINRMETGHYRDAVLDITAALAIDDRMLGRDHPLSARARLHLATAYTRLGEPDSALAALAISRAAFTKQLGPDHPSTLKARLYAARAWAAKKEWSTALAQVDSVDGRIAAAGLTNAVLLGIAAGVRGAIMEGLARFDEATIAYTNALENIRRAKNISRGQIGEQFAAVGRAKYLAGDRVGAALALDSAMNAKPNGEAAWYQYRLATDANNDTLALERLRQCAQLRMAFAGTSQRDAEEARSALKTLALKLGRNDVLEEFHLN